ncbi:MAG: tetratricopeptide repeat protein [Elusimicrobia bacterium]|nr:tetratricopeptide repeat protein [Candidatus Liberimonas magnetica]
MKLEKPDTETHISNYHLEYYNCGIAYLRKGNYELAIKDFNNTLQINPSYSKALYERGMIYFKTINKKQGLNGLNKAAKLGNQDAINALKQLGI